MNLRLLIIIAVLVAVAPWFASAATGVNGRNQPPSLSHSAFTVGKVLVVDSSNSKVTIVHDDIANLGMPGMTMVFNADSRMMAHLKAGELVKFKADRMDGRLVITELIAQ
jgi:Cu/Ag efflux protein CusF